jgi:hypothetical protein
VHFGPSEETAGGDPVVDEGLIVAATAEFSVVVRLVAERVERLEEILDGDRARQRTYG